MKAGLVALVWTASVFAHGSGTSQFVSGDVRVQVMSDRLVRIEERGPNGFEDRETFLVQNRDWPGPRTFTVTKDKAGATLTFGAYRIRVRSGAKKAADVTVETRKGDQVFRDGYATVGPISFAPVRKVAWLCEAVADSPRIVPPPWGATPVPPNVHTAFPATSGWDTSGSRTKDVYVFLADRQSREALVKDYLKLTGKIGLPPVWAFGLIDSRYHPYKQAEALGVIDAYRDRGMRLSGFVLDTDWRKGASTGYEVDTKLWPDIGRFFQDAHARGVRVMLNDHPAPIGPTALSPQEMEGRWNGLTSLLEKGADAWWYDRNWIVKLDAPVPGLAPEFWGQRVFHDVTQRFRPDRRPLILSNVQGIDNGRMNALPQPGFHRAPIMWTGDTKAEWKALQNAIANAVNGGTTSLLPFISEDLGGHRGKPSPELYVRFVQYGALSPIMRLHCASGETRFPWAFGAEAEDIVRQYVWMRYRLMPTIYSAARRAHDDGTPLLRPCDLSWVSDDESGIDRQYMLGDDLLVAPVDHPRDGDPKPVPSGSLSGEDGRPGLVAEFFAGTATEGRPLTKRRDTSIAFEWGTKSPAASVPADGFSVKWRGRLGPVPESGAYVLGTRADDGSRLTIDGRFIVAVKSGQDGLQTKTVDLEKGKFYDLEMTVNHSRGSASAALVWIPPSQRRKLARHRILIPPGAWTDLWTGRRVQGPKTLVRDVPLLETPMYLRDGAVVFLGDILHGFDDAVHPQITADVSVPVADGTTTRSLYEDDGGSNAYKTGRFTKTDVKFRKTGNLLQLTVVPGTGRLTKDLGPRDWTLKFRLPAGQTLGRVQVDGRPATVLDEPEEGPDVTPGARVPFFEPWGGAGRVKFVTVRSQPRAQGFTIRARLTRDARAG